jgi:hypothetical protein
MDSTIQNYRGANKKLKALIDASGGMSQWCPMLGECSAAPCRVASRRVR